MDEIGPASASASSVLTLSMRSDPRARPFFSFPVKGFYSHGFHHKTISPVRVSHLKLSILFPLVFSKIHWVLRTAHSPRALSASVRSGIGFLFFPDLKSGKHPPSYISPLHPGISVQASSDPLVDSFLFCHFHRLRSTWS